MAYSLLIPSTPKSPTPTNDLAHSVEFPNDIVHTLQTDDHIHVEQDGEARAQ